MFDVYHQDMIVVCFFEEACISLSKNMFWIIYQWHCIILCYKLEIWDQSEIAKKLIVLNSTYNKIFLVSVKALQARY